MARIFMCSRQGHCQASLITTPKLRSEYFFTAHKCHDNVKPTPKVMTITSNLN